MVVVVCEREAWKGEEESKTKPFKPRHFKPSLFFAFGRTRHALYVPSALVILHKRTMCFVSVLIRPKAAGRNRTKRPEQRGASKALGHVLAGDMGGWLGFRFHSVVVHFLFSFCYCDVVLGFFSYLLIFCRFFLSSFLSCPGA